MPWVAWLWGAVGVVWCAAAVATGSAVATVGLWLVAVVAGVLLPGVAVVRAVRRGTAAMIEDIGWGIPAGCLVALAGWAAGVVSPFGMPPWVFGPVVAVVLAALPATRARVLARPAPGWGLGPHLVIAGALLVAVALMTVDFLRFTPPPTAGGFHYPDTLFQLSVVGELRYSLDLTYPLVAGEPFSYHWFAHAVLAHLTGAGPDAADVVVRLAPALLVPAVVVTGAVVAREVAARVAAGPVFAVLLTVTGTTVATTQADGASVPVVQTYWWASLTTAFGWLGILATAGVALAFLRRRPGGSVPMALFVPFAVLAVGSKSSNLAVLVGGAGLAWVACLLTKGPARPAFGVAVVLGGLLLVARFTMYGGGNYGLVVDVFGGFERRAARLLPGLTDPGPGDLALTLPAVSMVAVAAALVLYFLPLLPRLAGLALLDRRDPGTWFFVGVAVAAVAGLVVFRHPGESETFFLVSAYPVLLAGSAWGLAAGWERAGRPVAQVVVGAALGLAVTAAIAAVMPADPRGPVFSAFGHWPTAEEMAPWRQAAHLLVPLGVLTAVALAALLVRRPVAWTAGLLGTGLLSTGLYLTAGAPTLGQSVRVDPGSLHVTAAEATAARWLAAHSAPDDVFAVNRVCVQRQSGRELPEPCTAKAFAFPALSGRTAYVAGWAYADRNLDSAWRSTRWWSAQPFWDPSRLAAQQAAFTDPTPERLAALYDDGVRWLVADARGAPVDDAALDRLAGRRFSTPDVRIWELRAP